MTMKKIHLVSGGCGFVGRNLVKRLLKTTDACLLIVDDLSAGTPPPDEWNAFPFEQEVNGLRIYGPDSRLLFLKGDFRDFLRHISHDSNYLSHTFGLSVGRFTDVYHFAAIVGGRSKIDGDPMMVALDLSIDAEFFYWVCQYKPERVLFPSSSAAYPVDLQTDIGAIALKESDINFEGTLGQPDMTYGWSKLTGEYLARIAAQYYGVSVACVRPFSGYGEDQDLTYPIPAIAARAAAKEDPFEVWGTGKQGRDFVHIDDCIDAILLAMDHISDGTAINIGSGKLTSFLEIIEVFCQLAGYQPKIKTLTDKPVGVHARYSNMEYVEKTFQWKPQISIEEGMKRVYEEALKNKK
jgi:UDP-glucose 4-epimerase